MIDEPDSEIDLETKDDFKEVTVTSVPREYLPPDAKVRCIPRRIWLTKVMVGVYLTIGGGLLLQPERFSLTPSYHNLVIFLPAKAWGVVYLGCAALLGLWLSRQSHIGSRSGLTIAAHIPAIALGAWWDVAFVIRYLTDQGTTIVNVVSWSLFTLLLLRSAFNSYEGKGYDS